MSKNYLSQPPKHFSGLRIVEFSAKSYWSQRLPRSRKCFKTILLNRGFQYCVMTGKHDKWFCWWIIYILILLIVLVVNCSGACWTKSGIRLVNSWENIIITEEKGFPTSGENPTHFHCSYRLVTITQVYANVLCQQQRYRKARAPGNTLVGIVLPRAPRCRSLCYSNF